jgi:hypothetical protein
MHSKKTKFVLALLWVLVAAAAATAATFAWFAFNPFTNVEPVSATVSQGDVSLLIANTQDGDFAASCALTPTDDPDALYPLSTADLSGFYRATAQSTEGISILYEDATEDMGSYAIHGTVYLKSLYGSCDVYLYEPGLSFGADAQALAALRLALRITTEQSEETYIFRLDDLGDTANAAATQTVPTNDTVVSAVSSGTAAYTQDPAQALSDYMAQEDQEDLRPGNEILASLETDEVASVEYWLYLEGCDKNCINDVQDRDFELQLAFAGFENS